MCQGTPPRSRCPLALHWHCGTGTIHHLLQSENWTPPVTVLRHVLFSALFKRQSGWLSPRHEKTIQSSQVPLNRPLTCLHRTKLSQTYSLSTVAQTSFFVL